MKLKLMQVGGHVSTSLLLTQMVPFAVQLLRAASGGGPDRLCSIR